MIKAIIINVLLTILMGSIVGCSKDDLSIRVGDPIKTGNPIKGGDPAKGGDYYVATWGNDENPGTFDKPWATWRKAFATANAGDIVYIRGGVYSATPNPNVNLSGVVAIKPKQGIGHSGAVGNPICFFNYPGETPILECKGVYPNTNYNIGIEIEYAEYIHIKGLTIRNLAQYASNKIAQGISTFGANFIFENCVVHNVGGRGFTSFSAAWKPWDGGGEVSPYSYDTTRFINCDAYNICDTLSTDPGNAGDGWKCHTYYGDVMSWEGCRAWCYSDDGIDPSGSGKRIFNNCWLMSTDNFKEYIIEGNGIKTAATSDAQWAYIDTTANLVVVTYCLAAYCAGSGFGNNAEKEHNNNAIFYNNTAYKCYVGFNDLIRDGKHTSTYKNNISYASTDVSEGYNFNVNIYFVPYREDHNSWDWKNSWPWFEETDSVEVTNQDFISLVPSGLTGPRQPDGSLPKLNFIHLAKGSDLINAGVDVGLPGVHGNPDLGAFESEW